ncbi:hypothetical protein D3C85_866610 [compost metagenome]
MSWPQSAADEGRCNLISCMVMSAGNSRAQNSQKSSMRIIRPNLTAKQTRLSSRMACSMVWVPLVGAGVAE